MRKKKVKTFSKEIRTSDGKAYGSFVKEVYNFCEIIQVVSKPQFFQSSAIADSEMITHHTAIVEYKENGS